MNSQVRNTFFFWLPRLLTVAYALVLAAITLKTFAYRSEFGTELIARFIQFSPSLFLLIFLGYTWKKPLLGSVLFLLLASVFGWYTQLVIPSANSFVLGVPAGIIAILFWFSWYISRTAQNNSSPKRKSVIRIILRVLGWLASIPVVAIMALTVWHFVVTAQSEQQFPSVGALVDVGEHRLYFNCRGRGTPTVILESGTGEWSFVWRTVQESLANKTRVCTYDRAGLGWSDVSQTPLTTQAAVQDLDALLTRTNLPAPYIFVGHSFGGPIMQRYARQFPDKVAGLVFVDALPLELYSELAETFTDYAGDLIQKMNVLRWIADLGLVRLGGETNGIPEIDRFTKNLPISLREIVATQYYRGRFYAEMMRQTEALQQEDMKDISRLGQLPAVPSVVITHGKEGDLFPGINSETVLSMETLWQKLQQYLADKIAQGRVVVAEQSGHYVPLDQPDIIVQEVELMLQKIRK